MGVALITKPRATVEHLGVWAYDRTSSGHWPTGRYVPVCNQERIHDAWRHVSDHPGPLSPTVKRKPLCSRCAGLLELLNNLAISTSAEESPR